MASATGETRVRVGIFIVGDESDELERLIDGLRGVGIDPVPGEPAPTPLIVAITAADGARPDEASLAEREVFPVTLVDLVPDVLPELSHVRPRVVGTEAAIRRLAAAVRYGGRNLVQWSRLASAAERWSATRSPDQLLREAEQSAAVTMLTSPMAKEDSEAAKQVRAFVNASRERNRRRRRRWRLVGVATAVVLAAATSISVAQGVAALAEGQRSLASADLATASRLVTVAAASTGRDPDLPLVLADLAVDLTPDPGIHAAVAAISATQVPHRSFALAGPGQQFAASGTGLFAYTTWQDDAVRVVDASAEPVATFDLGVGAIDAVSDIFLTDTGMLAVTSDTGIRLFDTSAGKEIPTSDDASSNGLQFFGWENDERMLAAQGSSVLTIDPRTGKREVIADSRGDAVIGAVDVSADGRWVATWDGSTVRVHDANSGALRHSAPLDGAGHLAVAEGGDAVFASRGQQVARIDFSGGQPTVDYSESISPVTALADVGHGYIAASDQRGEVRLYSFDAGTTPVTRFTAHLGEHTRLATAGADVLGSIGIDGYLRVWDMAGLAHIGMPTTVGVLPSSTALGDALSQRITAAVFPRATFRNQIRVIDSGDLAVVLDSGLQVLVVDGDDPSTVLAGQRAGLIGRQILAADGRSVIRTSVNQGDDLATLQVWPLEPDELAPDQPRVSAQIPLMNSRLGLEPFLVTADEGAGLAIATATRLVSFTEAGAVSTEIEYTAASVPLALVGHEPGRAVVVTDDGVLHSTDGSTSDLSALLPDDAGTDIVAGEFSGSRLLVLTERGALCAWDGERMVPLAPAGTLSGAGTLRVDADTGRIAHVGADATTVLEAGGRVLTRIATVLNIPVADVDFDGETLVAVTRIGTIARWRLDDDPPPAEDSAPRALTANERQSFGLDGDRG
ncbi:WD40 repeat domain-containing protein [Microbacterium sp. PA5]|uniref:WD40 repeat domain-containing protein n=1 Tax=Microbacterium sp. PA5 TaxID=3416654 RepID=UPI003CF7C2BE